MSIKYQSLLFKHSAIIDLHNFLILMDLGPLRAVKIPDVYKAVFHYVFVFWSHLVCSGDLFLALCLVSLLTVHRGARGAQD